MLRGKQFKDLLRYTLGQKVFAVAQELVVDQRLLNAHEFQWSSSRTQDGNGATTRSHSDVSGKRVPNGFAVASDSAVTKHPNESDDEEACC